MDGRQAKPGDKVSVHYAGKLANGAQFDSSSERGPIEVQIGHRSADQGDRQRACRHDGRRHQVGDGRAG